MAVVAGSRTEKRRAIPALVVAIAIPAFAIVASLATVTIAVLHGDRRLPDEYHWEGVRLDRDFARFRRAVELGVSATLEIAGGAQGCRLALDLLGELPETVEVALTHATRPEHDRRLRLRRVGGRYEAPCGPAPRGSWWVEIAEPGGSWSLRQHVSGGLERVELAAREAGAS